MHSSSTIPAGYQGAPWLPSARSGVLLVGAAIAGMPFVQQLWNVLALAGLPKSIGPVSSTAIILIFCLLMGSAGLKRLGLTPLPPSQWLQRFVFIAACVAIAGNKLIGATWVQSIAVLGMMSAGIIYMRGVDKVVRPTAAGSTRRQARPATGSKWAPSRRQWNRRRPVRPGGAALECSHRPARPKSSGLHSRGHRK